MVLWFLVAAAVAGALMLAWALARRWSTSIARVEEALFSGRVGRAQRIARRLWRRDPGASSESAFLYAVSLYVQGKDALLLDDLAPVVDDLPRSEQPWVAFLLFKAAARSRDAAASRKWRRVAGRAAELRPYLDSPPRPDPPGGASDVAYA